MALLKEGRAVSRVIGLSYRAADRLNNFSVRVTGSGRIAHAVMRCGDARSFDLQALNLISPCQPLEPWSFEAANRVCSRGLKNT